MPARVLILPLLTPEGMKRIESAGGTRRTSGPSMHGPPCLGGLSPPSGAQGAGTGGGQKLTFAFSTTELESIAIGMRIGGFDVRLLPPEPLPVEAFHPGRRQWQSTPILHFARERLKALGDLRARLIVVTDADIYEPGLSFTGGMAELGGTLALVSVARLQSGDRPKLIGRAVKEGLHEIGHTLGLEHCRDHGCVMFLSRSIADSDIKRAAFCPKCRAVLGRALR